MKKKVETIDIGNTVLCDDCNEDYTNSDATGGLLFGSHAVCPKCMPALMVQIKAYKEEWYVKGYCPAGMSFKDWILSLRGGNNTIKITTTNAKAKRTKKPRKS